MIRGAVIGQHKAAGVRTEAVFSACDAFRYAVTPQPWTPPG